MIRASVAVAALVALTAVTCACPRSGPRPAPGPTAGGGRAATDCPEKEFAPSPLPGVRPEHRTLAYWLARAAAGGDPDEALLTPTAVAAHNRALRHRGNPELGEPTLLAPLDTRDVIARVNARLDTERRNLEGGAWVDETGRRLPASALGPLERWPGTPAPAAELRVAVGFIPIRCSPLQVGFYKQPVDPAFDRNLCAAARPQEPLQVLARWRNGTLLARTRYVMGWIPADAALSPPVPAALQERVVRGPRVRVRDAVHLRADDGTLAQIPAGALLLAAGRGRVHFATRSGWHTAGLDATRSVSTAQPLTRRTVLAEAFRFLGQPYGWGDRGGGYDCSSFLLNLFATFGLELPRNSAAQSQAGVFTIDVGPAATERERLALIDAAAHAGVVLLHFPGHIMLYLGRTAEGVPMAIHSFAEYLRPCAAAGAGAAGARETLVVVDRVSVSTLELGRGTSRRSFLQRLTRIVILGDRLTPELRGVARPRAAAPPVTPAKCPSGRQIAVWVTPHGPNRRQPLRIIVGSSRPLDPVALKLVDPAGAALRPELHRLGGPPYGYWAEVPTPAVGTWTAVVGDGARVDACRHIKVRPGPVRYPMRAGPVWTPVRAWSRDTANFYALFVEQLFDYPSEDDRTWRSLHELLAVRDKNLLFDYFGRGEEEILKLKPDCADLPHFLRAYFAWKLGLPYGVRDCTRGGRGRPPTCKPLEITNLMPREEIGMPRALRPSLGGVTPAGDAALPPETPASLAAAAPPKRRGPNDDLKEVARFISREVASAVHSGSGRTQPQDSETDYYPVPLTRTWLRPGAVFADPYGHVLVLTRWLPQGVGKPGVLIGADAQPDGTIGRRRFWRGTFLFRPETAEGGAGFKEFRPVVARRRGGVLVLETLANDRLRGGRVHAPWSDAQNRGTRDDFYDRIDALTNPRPLDPDVRLDLLVDALDESVKRRINSVDNSERYLEGRPGTVVPMPTGYSIFETAGVWEDFSTPSRDMRLLIALDTVLGFPQEVARRPAHYGLAAAQAPAVVAALKVRLQEALRARTFSYRRSDGTPQTLTLRDVVARAPAFEVAYNPNDCIEVRWGAPPDSPERATCRRHAPPEQLARMASYRSWFRTRTRPPR